MTDQEINIAIAEACGWKGCSDVNCEYRKCQHMHKGGVVGFPESYSTSRYPDYPNDLNAMREAEKTLTNDETEEYCAHLLNATDTKDRADWSTRMLCAHATARQRAEAFLRTIGKWKE